MYELALFAGAGGGILGGKLLGWRTVCAVGQVPAVVRLAWGELCDSKDLKDEKDEKDGRDF